MPVPEQLYLHGPAVPVLCHGGTGLVPLRALRTTLLPLLPYPEALRENAVSFVLKMQITIFRAQRACFAGCCFPGIASPPSVLHKDISSSLIVRLLRRHISVEMKGFRRSRPPRITLPAEEAWCSTAPNP